MVRHCLVGGEQQGMSWCGQPIASSQRGHFISAQHALLSSGGENKLCPDCAEAMKVQIDKVAFEQKHMSGTHREERLDRHVHRDGVPFKPDLPTRGPYRGPTERIPPTLDYFGGGKHGE